MPLDSGIRRLFLYRAVAMHDRAYKLLRIHLPRTSVNNPLAECAGLPRVA